MDEVTEAQYTRAMERHGSEEFTEEDRKVQEQWLRQVEEEKVKLTQKDYEDRKARVEDGSADDDDRRLVKHYEREGFEVKSKGGDDVSAGNSSPTSSNKDARTTGNSESDPQSPAQTTEKPSKPVPAESSTVRRTGGSGTAKP